MILHRALGVFLIGVAGVAWAHEGVRNPAVKARMDGMVRIGDSTKVIGQMARGQTPFDRAAAEAAIAVIAEEGRRTPVLFAAFEDDPKSEAKPAIWDSFDDFSGKAEAMVAAAESADASTLEALRVSVGEIGRTCGACHEVYRE